MKNITIHKTSIRTTPQDQALVTFRKPVPRNKKVAANCSRKTKHPQTTQARSTGYSHSRRSPKRRYRLWNCAAIPARELAHPESGIRHTKLPVILRLTTPEAIQQTCFERPQLQPSRKMSNKTVRCTGCGETPAGGRPGINPRHNSNQISTGLQPLRSVLGFRRKIGHLRQSVQPLTDVLQGLWL